MGKNKQVDAYIAKTPDWARPILTNLRSTVHSACPDVEEEIKWGAPTFMYHGIMCGMIAFKSHCALHFWKDTLVVGEYTSKAKGAAMQFGTLKTVDDLPPKKALVGYIKKAMALNAAGVPVPRRAAKAKKAAITPAYFMAAIRRNKKALAAYEAFSPSHRREYIEWITDAKTDATRDRRVAQAVEWMAEGKARNWKYMKG